MKKIVLIATLFCVCVFADTSVLAKIGDTAITADDLQARLDRLPAQYQAYYKSDEGKQKLLDQMIDEKALYLEAVKTITDTDADVKRSLEQAKADIITSKYLKGEIEKIAISDTEIKDYYEKNKAQFEEKEKVRASHILVKTKAEALAAMKDLKAGTDFAAEAKKVSICPSAPKGGDLDYFTRGQMVKPFEDAAFALKTGEVSKEPIQTQFGWHIIKLTDRQAPAVKELSAVKADIRSELVSAKQKEKLTELIDAAKKKYPVSRS